MTYGSCDHLAMGQNPLSLIKMPCWPFKGLANHRVVVVIIPQKPGLVGLGQVVEEEEEEEMEFDLFG